MLGRELGPCPPELKSTGQRERATCRQSQGGVGRGPGTQPLLEAGGPGEGRQASGQGHRLLETDQPRSESWLCVTSCLHDHGRDAQSCSDLQFLCWKTRLVTHRYHWDSINSRPWTPQSGTSPEEGSRCHLFNLLFPGLF